MKDAKKVFILLIVFFLIVFFLIGGIYTQRDTVLPYIKRIPGAANILKKIGIDGATEDQGQIAAILESVKYKFVENSQSGNLFVITGEVINEFSVPRKSIKVTGKILGQGQKVAKEETVLCGNLLSDTELSNFKLDEIKKRLNNPSGGNKKVDPRNKLSFMIVFPSQPDMEEYTITVESSSPVQE